MTDKFIICDYTSKLWALFMCDDETLLRKISGGEGWGGKSNFKNFEIKTKYC